MQVASAFSRVGVVSSVRRRCLSVARGSRLLDRRGVVQVAALALVAALVSTWLALHPRRVLPPSGPAGPSASVSLVAFRSVSEPSYFAGFSAARPMSRSAMYAVAFSMTTDDCLASSPPLSDPERAWDSLPSQSSPSCWLEVHDANVQSDLDGLRVLVTLGLGLVVLLLTALLIVAVRGR